ncbi:DUF1674 domain-containing protein [Pseudoroseomonas oryzae]|uniref:DUF1674 domain-containing protein n=2 Tax=Teichococcus oryzae TaxID=1608942 RepID=A0A5B2TGR6_9PROT|nr:DUF1674 domain-containing protein [Pseudoroseomonas oryzae]
MASPEQEAANPAVPDSPNTAASDTPSPVPKPPRPMPREVDGPTGPEPTRYGDWERKGRVSDF